MTSRRLCDHQDILSRHWLQVIKTLIRYAQYVMSRYYWQHQVIVSRYVLKTLSSYCQDMSSRHTIMTLSAYYQDTHIILSGRSVKILLTTSGYCINMWYQDTPIFLSIRTIKTFVSSLRHTTKTLITDSQDTYTICSRRCVKISHQDTLLIQYTT